MSGEFGDETPMTAGEDISAANAMEKDRDYRGAISLLQRVVAEYPDLTIALNNLAHFHCQLGEYVDALAPIEHAVEVEPNHSRYRGSHLFIALHCPARRNAAPLHEELKRHFPHVGDYDFYGVQAYLRIGKPERAREILTNAKLPNAYAESLGATVENAIQVRKRYDSLRSELWANEHRDLSRESVLPVLEEVHAAYDVDPDIQASLGFRLRAAGEYERASQLLIRAAGGIDRAWEAECLANAGYCLIMLGEWPRAMYLLDAVMNALEAKGAANPYDIPGIVNWIGDQGMSIETMQPSAAEVLNRALLECPDKSLVSPAVEKMAALLRQFAARYSGAVRKE